MSLLLALREFGQLVHLEHQEPADGTDRRDETLRVSWYQRRDHRLASRRHTQYRLACLVARHQVLELGDEAVTGIAGQQVLLLGVADHRSTELGAVGRLEP